MILKAHEENVRKQRDQARADLLQKTKEVLNDEQFKKFKEAAERSARHGPRGRGGRGGANLERALDELKLAAPAGEGRSDPQGPRGKRWQATGPGPRRPTQKTKEVLSDDEFKKFKEAAERPAGPGGRAAGQAAPAPGQRGLTVDRIVERLMAFDKNKDGKIAKDELPERMQDLIARGDTNKDGVLDKDEIEAVALKLQQEGLPRGFAAAGGGPGRGGANLERARRLETGGTEAREGRGLRQAHQENVRKQLDQARADLVLKTKDVLSEAEFKKFKEAAERPSGRGRRGRGGNHLERALDNLKLAAPKQEKVAVFLRAAPGKRSQATGSGSRRTSPEDEGCPQRCGVQEVQGSRRTSGNFSGPASQVGNR